MASPYGWAVTRIPGQAAELAGLGAVLQAGVDAWSGRAELAGLRSCLSLKLWSRVSGRPSSEADLWRSGGPDSAFAASVAVAGLIRPAGRVDAGGEASSSTGWALGC